MRRNNSLDAWEKLISMNSLDVEFFEYARKLAHSNLMKESHFLGHYQQLSSDKLNSPQEFLEGQSRRRMSGDVSISGELPFCKFSTDTNVQSIH